MAEGSAYGGSFLFSARKLQKIFLTRPTKKHVSQHKSIFSPFSAPSSTAV